MEPKPKPLQVPNVAFVTDDEAAIGEMLYDGHRTAFAVYRRGETHIENSFKKDAYTRFVPYGAANNIIRNRVVLFPTGAEEYGSENELFDEIRWYIHRYVDVPARFERICAAFVMLSWVYDRFNEIPYLRVRGDYGSGKTRFLAVVGSVCYRPIFASGASTVSPLFHLIDSFKGTLLIDEADFRWSDEKAEIVKILNNGNVRGMPVLRTHVSREREYNPRAFQVFGPKIVATRGCYDDPALESRFLTHVMGSEPLRADVPISLPASQAAEAAQLRNQLLMYRFRTFHKTAVKPCSFESAVDPRLKQIFAPLMSIVDDPVFRDELSSLASEYTRQIAADRGLRIEAQLLTAIRACDDGETAIPIKAIVDAFSHLYGGEYDARITHRWIGGLIRRKLGLSTRKSNGNYVIPAEATPRLVSLYAKYAVEHVDLPPLPHGLPTIHA